MFNSSTNGGYSLSDIAAITGHNNDNNSAWGGDGAWLIIILFLFCFMGWGDNGFGNTRGGAGAPQGTTTREEISYGFDMNGLENGIRGIQNGLCDGFYSANSALMSGLAGVNTNLASGFSGVNNAVCSLGYQTQQGFNDTNLALLNASNAQAIAAMQNQNSLQTQISDCCCTTQSNLKDIAYQMATDTCSITTTDTNNARDIIDSQNENTRAILAAIQQNKVEAMQDKIDTLTAQNNQLAFQASQQAQNAYLLNHLQPSPIPAYTVSSPYASYYGCGIGA